jgi:hypothetical protein
MNEQDRKAIELMYSNPATADEMQQMDDDDMQYAHYFD